MGLAEHCVPTVWKGLMAVHAKSLFANQMDWNISTSVRCLRAIYHLWRAGEERQDRRANFSIFIIFPTFGFHLKHAPQPLVTCNCEEHSRYHSVNLCILSLFSVLTAHRLYNVLTAHMCSSVLYGWVKRTGSMWGDRFNYACASAHKRIQNTASRDVSRAAAIRDREIYADSRDGLIVTALMQ